jgi:hypothetical protein
MSADKRLFAPVPLRAMAFELSGLQMRVLACVAAHDRMSLATGKGQGCRASNDRMSVMVDCSFARICSTLSELVELGFLEREKLGRHTVYRVVYNDDDTLLFSNLSRPSIGCRTGSNDGSIGCRPRSSGGGKLPETPSQYIPLNGGIDSVETGEDNSSEEARFAARIIPVPDLRARNSRRKAGVPKGSATATLAKSLAVLERSITAGDPINRLAEYRWIGDTAFVGDHPDHIRQWAMRLADKLVESMNPAELTSWQAEYGVAA